MWDRRYRLSIPGFYRGEFGNPSVLRQQSKDISRPDENLFVIFGEPDIELICADAERFQVRMKGCRRVFSGAERSE